MGVVKVEPFLQYANSAKFVVDQELEDEVEKITDMPFEEWSPGVTMSDQELIEELIDRHWDGLYFTRFHEGYIQIYKIDRESVIAELDSEDIAKAIKS